MDPVVNVVVFQLRGEEEPLAYEMPARADDEVRAAWHRVREEHPEVGTADVVVVSCAWQPGTEDAAFVAETFPDAELAAVRPRPDSPEAWAIEFAAMAAESDDDENEDHQDDGEHEETEVADAVAALEAAGITALGPNDEGFKLLPALLTEPDEQLGPMIEQVPDALYATVGLFGWTPRRTIGWRHLAHEDGAVAGVPAATVLEFAWRNLADEVRIGASDAEPTRDTILELSRDGGMASSIVTVPSFTRQIGGILGADRLVVGIPCQDTAWVTAADSAGVATVYEYVRQHTHTDYLVPSVYLVDEDGIQLLDRLGDGAPAARPRRQLTPGTGAVGLATSNVPCGERPSGTDEIPLADAWPVGTGAS
jgi:hypothetical protein